MKRKKLYSMLALSMAMALVVGTPVSAAVSVDTGNFADDIQNAKDETVKSDVTQDVATKVDESGNTLKIEITSSASDGAATITEKLNTKVEQGAVSEKVSVTTEEITPDEKSVTKAEIGGLKDTSVKQLNAIDASKIMISIAERAVAFTPVQPHVQKVAAKAADAVAKELGRTVAEGGLVASADIYVERQEGDGAVKVTIPLTDENKPDTANYDYFVLHFNGTEWETLPIEITEDGIIVATFDSFSPVFVVKTEKAPADNNGGDDNNGGGGDSNDDNSSPVSVAKATPAANTPVNPAVSPKTGE